MAERTERHILSELIETCRDAERGFLTAAEQVEDVTLKSTLLELADQRHRFVQELLPHAQLLGAHVARDGTAVAALHRAWLTVRGRLASEHDRAIVEEAERGERVALSRYDRALDSVLPGRTRELVELQDAELRHTQRRLDAATTSPM